MSNEVTPYTTFDVAQINKTMEIISDDLAEEVPVEIRYNERSYAVLMATPQNLPELAVGFSLSENIVSAHDRIDTVLVQQQGDGFVIDVGVVGISGEQMREIKRNMAGRTGCGLCGLEKLEDLPDVRRRIHSSIEISAASIYKALRSLDEHQPLRRATGAVHGAAWVSLDGDIQAVYEDVGRHNALDKLIGWGARRKINWAQGWILISSRASFEMVQKAANTGTGLLVAVSAPTAKGVRLARRYGLTLAGFASAERLMVYSYPKRIRPSEGNTA